MGSIALMRKHLRTVTLAFLLALFFTISKHKVHCDTCCQDNLQLNLMRDLMIVDCINQKICDRLPVTFNYFMHGGYLVMPSARMGEAGELSFGYTSIPPYRIYSARCQFLERMEISGNYRIFKGVEDPVLSQYGFGDYSDKGINVKFSILHPEDTHYQLPGLAIGFEDFLGTKGFHSSYAVLTQVLLACNMEVSVGYGTQRIKRWFGGISLMPWRKSCYSYLRGISLVGEYDATDYKNPERELHPDGRDRSSFFNYGVKYRWGDWLDLSLSRVRGREIAFSISAFYNFGTTKGFLPKVDDPLPYCAPCNTEPLGVVRPEGLMIQEFCYALSYQGFELLESWLTTCGDCQKVLRLHILNLKYRTESEVRCRLNHLLACLTPSDIAEVIVVIESEGFPVQEYHYRMECLRQFWKRKLRITELDNASPLCEVSCIDYWNSCLLFAKERKYLNFELLPKTKTAFGSATGKFKYALGVSAGINGFIWNDVYYSLQCGYLAISTLQKCSDCDRLNPSQLINVRTDLVNYYKTKRITIDEAFLQKNWNICRGFYARLAGGHFEQQYGGAAAEFLYYPVSSCWAIGLEGAILRKRKTSGIAFTHTIRKLDGFVPSFRRFKGSQYFLDFYYSWKGAQLDFKVSYGKFLANDRGVRFQISRYYTSGMRFSFWYTLTNAHDVINGSDYHDTGFEFSIPLDIFFTCSSRSTWGYGMSAWLRDSSCRARTGKSLYPLIHDLRK